MKTEEELIWEAYNNDELRDIVNILKTKYKNRRVVATNDDKINLNIVTEQDNRPKPRGLWYALGGEWLQFLTSEWENHGMEYDNVFHLNIDYSSILRINNTQKFDEFEQKYSESGGKYKSMVDWRKVSQDYKGVEIIPYNYSKRLKSMWYYGWDIGSGCIWDTSAIKNYNKINI
jgi:hypothetical protein